MGNNRIWSICEDQPGVLWIGTSSGLDRFDRATKRFTHYQHDLNDPSSVSSNFVLSLYKDPSGALWVGTWNRGLDKLVLQPRASDQELDQWEEQWTHYQNDANDPYSLSDNRVWAIYRDRSGVLWIGTGDTTYTLVIELEPTDLNLRPGMNAEVEIMLN